MQDYPAFIAINAYNAPMKLILRKPYLVLTLLLLIIELLIFFYLDDPFIRPFVGDFLVVIFMYVFLRSFLDISVLKACIYTLLFAYGTECLQYLKFTYFLGLEHNRWAQLFLGTTFHWGDMLAYTLGIALVLGIEKWRGVELS